MPLSEQSNHFEQPRMLCSNVGIKHGRSAKRQQPYHGTDLQPRGISVGEMKEIVEESILLIPHFVVALADTIHSIGDPGKMFEETVSNLFVHRVGLGKNERNLEHRQAVECHPCRAVRLVEMPAGREFRAPIKYTDVVQSEEPAGKNVSSLRILAIYPPLEVQHQPLEGTFQETNIRTAELRLNSVEKQSCPGVHRRVHVAEVPFVCGNLTVRMGIQIPKHQQELVFGEIKVHKRERNGVKGQIPRRIPRILPLVG